MDLQLIETIHLQNPWLNAPLSPLVSPGNYIPRHQIDFLLQPDWDFLWMILVGPRQSGKTTIGKFLCKKLIDSGRYKQLFYLNCDFREIRQWLESPSFLEEAEKTFQLKNYILFIDEVQRLESPGLLLKIIADLKLPIKMIASGSSQLEIKSKVQEHLTGRQLETLILPLSGMEINFSENLQTILTYGTYPQVYLAQQKQIFLQELFHNYIQKDIVEFLQVGKPDVIPQLLGLLAHSSGQLLNFQQLAVDCRIKVDMLRNYMDILEKTYVIKTIKPYVGNKRTELTSNPICYFIDNGFRNQALNNFTPIESRTDNGLLVENLVFQELYKYSIQERKNWQIYYWRTKAGAEVDFILKTNFDTAIPVEVKYRNSLELSLTRGYKSYLEAYNPALGFVITKNQVGSIVHEKSKIYFIPLANLHSIFEHLKLI
ncbi:MAG: ATP-binding protein [Bdellovibrionota bacterium]